MAAWTDRETRRKMDAARDSFVFWTTRDLRDLIACEREQGRAFGRIAEACRDELARRGEQG